MTTKSETPTPTPQDKPAKSNVVEPAFAIHRINGDIEPGTMFRPASKKDRAELLDLQAIRDLTKSELAVFDKIDADPLG